MVYDGRGEGSQRIVQPLQKGTYYNINSPPPYFSIVSGALYFKVEIGKTGLPIYGSLVTDPFGDPSV
jgi:hypothetical protein